MSDEVEALQGAVMRWLDLPPESRPPLHEYVGMSQEDLKAWLMRVYELLGRPRLYAWEQAQDLEMLARARTAYAAAGPDDWVTYTEEDLDELRRARVRAAGEQIVKQDAELLARLAAGPNDFFEEDEPVEDVVAAFEAGRKTITGGVGWCAPSP